MVKHDVAIDRVQEKYFEGIPKIFQLIKTNIIETIEYGREGIYEKIEQMHGGVTKLPPL